MSNPFDELGLGEVWNALKPGINKALDDGHIWIPDEADEQRLDQADELARRMEDDS